MEIKRGEIYMANLSPVIGSEQGGDRPVLIIQNDMGNKYSPTTVVAAITSRTGKKPKQPTHVMLHGSGLFFDSMVMLEQIRTIDKMRLGRYIGKICNEDMKKVADGIRVCVGIKED